MCHYFFRVLHLYYKSIMEKTLSSRKMKKQQPEKEKAAQGLTLRGWKALNVSVYLSSLFSTLK